MIVKYTEQEEQQLKKLGRVAGAKLDRLNQIIRESTKDSEEYKNAIKEATELDYELFKARAAIYNQAEQREFSKVSSSVKSIVQNAKEQTEAIIDDIYQTMFYILNGMQDTIERVENHLKAGDASKEGEGFLLDSAWTIERIRTHLHLHFDALKNHDAAIKEINDYIIAAVARKPFLDAMSKYDATAPTKQRFDPPLPLTTDAFFPIYHGKPTRSLATMSSRMIRKDNINPITGTAKIEGKGVKFELSRFEELKGALGVNTHKLLMVGIKELTRLNNESNLKAQSMKYIVSIPLEGYCTSCGYNVTEQEKTTPKEQAKEKRRAANALKDATRKIRNDLQILKSLTMSWEDPSIKFRGSNAFYDIGVIGSSVIQQGYIYMSFDPLFSEYLVKSTIMQYPIALLGVDARSPNAYSIGLKMAWHYSIYNNHKKGTHDRLKVITLLEETTLPTYEEVVKTRKSWEERLKEPLENALDHLTQINFLKDWRYCKPKGETLEDADADFADYETWADTLLQFEMTNAPNHDDILKKLEEEKQATIKAGKKKSN
jgi:hypothetical protein